jgi:hypothetical protein
VSSSNAFEVARGDALLGRLIHDYPELWIALGDLETRLLRRRLRGIECHQPIYVTALARAGTTILLEFLAALPRVVTHRYRDFPALFTPYLWNLFLDWMPRRASSPRERAHGDRIQITPESPEAMEEPLWMAFFSHLHRQSVSQVLDGQTANPAFELFYRDHIRKLLYIRRGSHYVAKSNYSITRLEYLLKLFPDARFVIPIREPTAHIASLRKQQRLFEEKLGDNPRARAHLRQVGHFEFGADRRPIHTGDVNRFETITQLWKAGREVAGWAHYWDMIYRHIADRLAANPALRAATLVMRYEDLCCDPGAMIDMLLRHVNLTAHNKTVERYREQLSRPKYYTPSYDTQELALIAETTGATAQQFGYS